MSPSEVAARQEPGPLERVGVFGVVVTHQGPGEMLNRCLDSISEAGGVEHIVVVDNSGRVSDRDYGAAETIDSVLVENRGFGAAVNS